MNSVIAGDANITNNQGWHEYRCSYEEHFPKHKTKPILQLSGAVMVAAAVVVIKTNNDSVDVRVRREFYNLFHWHKDVRACRRQVTMKPRTEKLRDTYAASKQQ